LSERPLRVVLPEPVPGAQEVQEGWALSGPKPVAGLEVAALASNRAPSLPATAEGRRLENAWLRVELAEDGTLRSVYDKRAGREALAGPGNQLWAYVDRPRSWDAWDLEASYAEQGEQVGVPDAIEVVEDGPHRAAIRLRWRCRSSAIVQTVRLCA